MYFLPCFFVQMKLRAQGGGLQITWRVQVSSCGGAAMEFLNTWYHWEVSEQSGCALERQGVETADFGAGNEFSEVKA